MKKILTGALVGLCALSLASCGGKDNGPQDNPNVDGNKPNIQESRTKIQYLGWDLGTEEKPMLKDLLIDKFNETNKTYYIEKIKPNGDYTEFLNALAAANSLPDVYLTQSVPNNIINDQALMLNPLVSADSEWNNVVDDLKQAATYNGDKVYAIPSAQNYLGFYANYTLLDNYASWENAENIPAMDKFAPGAFTTDEFFAAVKATKELNADGSSVIGLSSAGDIINWLPSIYDETNKIKQFVWDGEKFDFMGKPMLDALTKIQDLTQKGNNYTYESFSKEIPADSPEGTLSEVKKYFGNDNYTTAFQAGQVGFYQGATWDTLTDIHPETDYKFVGYPDKKVVSAADFLCISKATKNQQGAYEVAKFLSFGQEGINARFDIVKNSAPEAGIQVGGLPIVKDKALTDKWFELITTPGFKEVHELVSAGEMTVLVEGNKVVPGFELARFKQDTGIVIDGVYNGKPLPIGEFIWQTCEGKISLNDYKTNLTPQKLEMLNKIITDSMKEISKK